MKSKKAISGVVVTILIVLLAIVAVTILWYALKPTIEKSAGEIGEKQSCLYLDLTIQEAKYESGSMTIKVHRDVGEASLQELKFLIDGEAKDASPDETIDELGTKTYTISVTEKPSKIEVAGVLEGDILCSISDSVEGNEIQ